MAGKISSENTFAHDFSKKLRSRLVSRRLRSNMDNCWLPLALYDIFRHHPVFIYIISNLKYCVTPLLTLMSHFGTNHIVHKNLTFYFLSRSIFIIVLGQKRGSKPVRFSSSPHHTSEGREDIFFLCSQNRARKKPGNRMVSGFFGAISFLVAQCGCGDRTRTCDLRVMSPTSYQLLYSAI